MRFPRRWGWNTFLALSLGAWTSAASTASAQTPMTAPPGLAAPERAEPRPGEFVVNLVAPHTEVSIVERQSRIVQANARIRTVEDFDQSVVDIGALSPQQLRMQAMGPGVTTVRITDENNNVYSIDVFVEKDLRELQANITRLFPGSAIRTIGVKDNIVLQGWVTQPEQIPHIVKLAETYSAGVQNHIQVGGGSLVQLSVKIMEVQRSKLEQFGLNFLTVGQNYFFHSSPGSLVPLSGLTIPSFAGPPNVTLNQASLANSQMQFAILGNNNAFSGFLEALKQESLLKILAEPTVSTNSGRPAVIHSGGEFPILVPQGIGTATIQYRQFGVRMETVPIVLGNGRVHLDIASEVSERDFSNSVDVNGFRVPGITSRDVNTGVDMNFGETLMIGGLISNRLTVSTNKIPYLGDIPYIGAAFSRKNHQIAETELIILVTPNLVAPMNACQVPPNGPGLNSDGPTTHELFWDQHVEVPYFGPECGPGCPVGPGMMMPGMTTPGAMMDSSFNPMTVFPEGAMSPPGSIQPYSPGSSIPFPPTPNDPFGNRNSPAPMPAPEASAGGVETAAWSTSNARQRATPAGFNVPASNGYNTSVRNTGATQISSPPNNAGGATPGLISPDTSFTRPTPRFVGSSPAK